MMASAFIDNLDRMGLLAKVDPSVRYWIDSLTALNDIKENPHAIVLYNIDATPRDEMAEAMKNANITEVPRDLFRELLLADAQL